MIKEVEITQRSHYVYSEMTQKLKSLELGLGSLKVGYLPTQFVNYNKLKRILTELQRNIPQNFS